MRIPGPTLDPSLVSGRRLHKIVFLTSSLPTSPLTRDYAAGNYRPQRTLWKTLPSSTESRCAAGPGRLSWMSSQIVLREISLEILHLYQCEDHFVCHHRETENEDNMWNLKVNEHQGLEICFIRCKLASIMDLEDDQFTFCRAGKRTL